MDNFDPGSPLLIAQGTLTLAVLGSATGGTLAAFKAQNPFVLGMNMGLNGGIAGLAFFGIREYLVSPVLLLALSGSVPSYQARHLSLLSASQLETSNSNSNSNSNRDQDQIQYRGKSSSSRPPTTTPHAHTNADAGSGSGSGSGLGERETLNRVRNDRVLDSALAGGLTGGIISGAFRGRKTIPRSFVTSALITAVGQYVVNNGRVARLEILGRREERARELGKRGEVERLREVGVTDPRIRSTPQAISSSPPTSPGTTTQDFPSISTRLVDFIHSLSPVRKISDLEYLRILERQRDEMRRDMQVWEDRMRVRYPDSNSNSNSTSTSTSNSDSEEDGGRDTGAGSKQAASTGQTIDIGQLYRQLDSVERRIKGLEGKIAGEGAEAAARV